MPLKPDIALSLPVLEIASIVRRKDGLRYFALVYHGRHSRAVWTGPEYEAAILAAERWHREGVEVVDTVLHPIR